MNTTREPGQLLPLIIVILLGFSILITVISLSMRNESEWTVKENKSSMAFHLAEAGIDRAVWKINESATGWDKIIHDGIFPENLDGSVTFDEPDKGSYKVRVSSCWVDYEDLVIIHSVGIDKTSQQIRGLKVIYSKAAGANSAILSVGGVSFGGNADVHWGPVMNSEGDVTMGNTYPRKYAGIGYIVDGRDPDGVGGTDIGPTNGAHASNIPMDDEYKDWSSNGVREISEVEVDLSEYSAKAKAYTTPASAPDRANAVPPNSGYYPASACPVSFPIHYCDTNANAVYFFEGDVNMSNSMFVGPNPGTVTSECAFIVLGDITLPGGSGSTCTSGSYTVNIPTHAWKEYQAFDTAATGEYPGDNGFQNNSATFDVNGFTSGNCVFHGLIYVSGDLKSGTANKKLVGVIIVKGSVIHQSGTLEFYYSKVVDEHIKYSGLTYTRQYWAEFLPGSFDSPDWSIP